jgi:hypothetical protein
MPLGRDIRRLQNAKESSFASGDTKSVLSHSPAARNMRDGEQVFSQEGNKQLSLYKKHKGMLWKARFSRDGNQYVDKDLKVNGDIKCGGTFKSSDNTEGLTDTITFNDEDGETHGVTIKDGLITSWNIS